MSSPIKASIKLIVRRPASETPANNPSDESKIKDAVFRNKSLKSNKLVNTTPAEPSTSLKNVTDVACSNISQLMCTSLEHLPRLAIHDAKETLIRALITSRSTLQKLQSVCEWSAFAQETHSLLNILNEQDVGARMIEVADKLAIWHQGIQQAPLPVFNVQLGIRVFLGMAEPNWTRDPTNVPSDFNQDMWITQLNDLVRLRLVQHHIPFQCIEQGEATLCLHSINIRITVVPDDNWFVTRADSNALCSLLQTHFNYMPTADGTFHAKLQSLMGEYLRLWIFDRFSVEAKGRKLSVRHRDAHLEIMCNSDASIILNKDALSLSVSAIDKVIDIPFAASFSANIKAALDTALDTISSHAQSLLESTLVPFGFNRHTDYMTYFKNEHSTVYYDMSRGLVIFVPLLKDADEFKFDNFSCPLSRQSSLVSVLEEYRVLLEDRSLFHSLQHDFRVTKQKLLLGAFSSFYVYTRHPNCIINYSDKKYTLHYCHPSQATSHNALPIEHPSITNAAHFLERFVLDSELKGRVDYKLDAINASAEITSIAHLSAVKSITFSCLADFKFEAQLAIRDRFGGVPFGLNFTAEHFEALLDWSYDRVALLALVQQAKLVEKPIQFLSENLVRVGEREIVVGDKLECIIEMT